MAECVEVKREGSRSEGSGIVLPHRPQQPPFKTLGRPPSATPPTPGVEPGRQGACSLSLKDTTQPCGVAVCNPL